MSSPYSPGEDRYGRYDPNAGIPGFGSSTSGSSSAGSAPYDANPYAPTPYGPNPYSPTGYDPNTYESAPGAQEAYGAPEAYGQPAYGYAGPGQPAYGSPPPGYGAVQPMPGYPQGYGPAAGRKEPGLSLLASFFVPGLGTMMNGQVGKGLLILCLYGIAVLFSFILIGVPFLVGIWIWGLVDGYQGAQRHNYRHGWY